MLDETSSVEAVAVSGRGSSVSQPASEKLDSTQTAQGKVERMKAVCKKGIDYSTPMHERSEEELAEHAENMKGGVDLLQQQDQGEGVRECFGYDQRRG